MADSSSDSEDLEKRKTSARLLEQGERRRSSERDDRRNRTHFDHTQRTATKAVGGSSISDADYVRSDVPAVIPASGQVKRNVSAVGTILTDEEVEMARTPMLHIVGIDSGRAQKRDGVALVISK